MGDTLTKAQAKQLTTLAAELRGMEARAEAIHGEIFDMKDDLDDDTCALAEALEIGLGEVEQAETNLGDAAQSFEEIKT